ncbi:Reverse_transcriptase (RNA-dependent DNA polymerase) [Hexamita inflata]|uniref:Reverse transcriptase (RNA-dependent DNA polymerase) n=1 Tax=Hexamita inflata TaxID=28002 RepID=A0AA86Q6D8_9EUKA|nr:Reverse transcriptase (RNA-dependent DNA polymerase) [Hexamita inflata]
MYADDFCLITVPGYTQRAIDETIILFEELKLTLSKEKCQSTDDQLFSKTGIISFLGQEFGKTAKPLAEQVVKKVMLKVNGLAHLSIATKYKLIMFGQTVVTAANYAPLIDVAENNAQTIKLYNEIDQLLANHMEQIIQSGAATEEVISFMSAYKCIGGLSMILPGLNYASMHDDMISKTKNHAPTHKVGFDLQTEVAKNYFKEKKGKMRAKEIQQNTIDDTVPKVGYAIMGYGMLPNESIQHLIDLAFGKYDVGMPKVCELCGCNAKAGHEQACKVINEIHIKVHDVFANYLEKQLRKKYNAIKVTAGNDNRALNNKKPDVEITVDGKKVYLDIGITFDTKRYFRIKQNHYAQMKDQNGEPLRVIPIIIGKNCTIHTKSREFLDELDIRMESVYEEIGNLLGVYKANCTAIMYKKKVIRRDEINDHEDVIPGNQNNRFAALASDDIRIPKKNPHAAINEYLANTVRQTTQPNVQATIQKKSEKVKPKSKKPKKQKPKRKPDIPAQPLIPQVVSAPHSTERREQVNFQINQNEILLSLPVIQEEVRMELTMQNNKTETQILCSQYIAEISLSRVNEHEQEETDQRVMTLFPALNLEALRVAADTLVPRFIPAIPKIVTKITSEVNNVSSSAELTQVV